MDGSIDAARDVAVINFELILSDLSQLERAVERATKSRGKVSCEFDSQNSRTTHLMDQITNVDTKIELYKKLCKLLESGQPARNMQFTTVMHLIVLLLVLFNVLLRKKKK